MNRKIIIAVIVIALVLIIFLQNKNSKYNPLPAPGMKPSPSPKIPHPDWKTFTDSSFHIIFEYPAGLPAKYIRPQNWPPKITLSSGNFSCKERGEADGQPLILQKTIGDTTYCIQSMTQGAAGTIYTDYTYTFLKDDQLISLQFTLAYPQCGNFEDAQNRECEKERQSFDLDTLINQITATVKLDSDNPVKSGPVITSPQANSRISSPLRVKGTAPAGWMFEGVFPIKLLDENRKIIAQSQAKEVVPGSWNTGSDVEFNATLTFSTQAISGFLVLEKDNPSGLPEKAASFEIPVTF